MVWYILFVADIIVSRLATQPLHGVGQLGVTSVKLKSHHLLRDWPILKIREKKFLQSTEIAFQKRAILNFRLSGFPPCCCDKTATKNKVKTHLKHVLTGDRESGCLSTTTHLAKLAHAVLFFPEHKCPSQKRINACTGLKGILKHADKVTVRRSIKK